ncbi:MAG: hypothetical protein IJ131_05500, partial [Eggerthellaceae bacterium]|nr:hypothetical protein [Eggerthellaceae bacterium]
MAKIIEGIPLASIPAHEGGDLYSVVQNSSGYATVGSLERVVEEFCGMSAIYPYTLDGHVHDDWVDHEHFFGDLLKVVLEHPATFSIPDQLKGYYSEQQLRVVDAFQTALLQTRPRTQADIAEQIARAAHWGQRDKGGDPYIGHPAHVAEMMDSDEA